MECYITYCVKGFLAFNSENELISEKLFPEDEILNRLADIDDKKIVPEEMEIIDEVSRDHDEIIIESNKRKSDYGNEKVTIKNPNPAGEYLRSNYEEFGLDNDEITEIYRNLAIYKIKKESASEDKHLIQAINTIDEIDESISKQIERIREWYALYFPEMDVIKNNETYIKLISQNKTKEEIINAKPEAFPGDIIDLEEDINPKDIEIMNNYANSIYEMQQTRKNLEEYVDFKMQDIAPNLRLLVGSSLGAKLISHAGGLKRLAVYPSSTVQIMGAEKALFRHLKSGDRPPKYGLIYQHPQVRGAKWWNRGKIARMLAGMISHAARRDVFTKTFDENAFDEFIKKAEEIEKNNPFPTKTTKKRNEERSKGKNKKRKGKKKRKRR
ncbi:MAG: ATP-binding protein [Methanobrevibacter thaueri]|uniref:ATP-binding protein n=1 Tax=Methanobrevibacter thaueri TaxID=190975 RepID=A0A8T3V5P0_9EURY|nr:ATP-binding protein [Methanobrevibacter thaueri]MBE6501893.1 ATP-binding protein [Methanobrevibacter thaueri]